MWARGRLLVAVAICVGVLVTFIAHKPACSDSHIVHNKPVPAFRALSADTYVKAGVAAMVQVAVVHNNAVAEVPQLEPAEGELSPPFPTVSCPSLACCLLC